MARKDNLYYDITIDTGGDFELSFTLYGEGSSVVDLTGAIVRAQLREYPEGSTTTDFVCTHNDDGGQITISMVHEATRDLGYSYGWFDIKVTYPNGSVEEVMHGKAFITAHVTRPQDGGTPYTVVAFESFDDFPTQGNLSRIYLDREYGQLYYWTGSQYLPLLYQLKGDAATIRIGTTSTGAPGTNASVTNSGTIHDAVFNFTIPRGEVSGDAAEALMRVTTSELTSITADTPAYFSSQGNRFYHVRTNLLTGQPSTYGFLYNIVYSNGRVSQIWISLPDGEIYTRGGTTSWGADGWIEYARHSELANYLPLIGGILTGNLTISGNALRIKNPNDTESIAPSSEIITHGLGFFDSQDNQFGFVRTRHFTGGQLETTISSARHDVGSSTIFNGLSLGIRPDGTRYVTVTEAAPWLSALGAVDKTGDTMTGQLTINNNALLINGNNVRIKNPNDTESVVPSSAIITHGLAFLDSQDNTLAAVRSSHASDGTINLHIFADRHISSMTAAPVGGQTTFFNELKLGIKPDGTRVVSVTESSPWLDALGAVSKAGDTMTGTLTLAEEGLRTPNGSGYVTDQYGNLKHQSSNTQNYFALYPNADDASPSIKMFYENGTIETTGNVNINKSTEGGISLRNGDGNSVGAILKNSASTRVFLRSYNTTTMKRIDAYLPIPEDGQTDHQTRYIPTMYCGTSDLTAGTTVMASNTIYLQYE